MAIEVSPCGVSSLVGLPSLYNQAPHLINQESDHPGHHQLEQCGIPGPFPASGLPFNGGQRGDAWDIQQAEHHQAVGIQCPKSHTSQHAHQRGHARRGGDISHSEQYGTAGHHHFLGGNTGNQRHHDLPVAQPQRFKYRDNKAADHRSEAVADLCGDAAGGVLRVFPVSAFAAPPFDDVARTHVGSLGGENRGRRIFGSRRGESYRVYQRDTS